MSGDFDPYFKWLSIPPEQQPPNHYRLLGVPEFVDDADVIENAADKQTMMLRTLGTGKHAALSQRLLNEISSAKLTLLDTMQKAAYDAQLRQRLAPPAPVVPRTRPAQPTLPTAVPVQAAALAPQVSINTVAPSAENPLWQKPKGLIAIGCTLAMLIVGGFLLALNSSEEETPETAVVEPVFPDPPKRESEPKQEPKTEPEAQPQPETRPSPDPESEPQPKVDPPASTETSPQADSRVVDLLSKIDLEKDSLRGKWSLENGELSTNSEPAILQLSNPIQSSQYDVTMVVRNIGARHHITMGLVGPSGKTFAAAITSENSGLQLLDGKLWHLNSSSSRQNLPGDHKPHTLVYQVREEGVTVLLDGKTFLRWQGEYGRLTHDFKSTPVSKQKLFLTARNIAIEKLRFQPLGEGRPPANTGPVDLLNTLNLDRDTLGGKWTLEQGVLQGTVESSLLQFEHPVRFAEYDVMIVARSTNPKCHVNTGLVSPLGRQFAVVTTWFKSGLNMLDGKVFHSNSSTTARIIPVDGKPYTLIYQVRKNGVTLLLDGKPRLQWRGDYQRLTRPSFVKVTSNQVFFLGSHNVAVEKLEFRPLIRPGSTPVVQPTTTQPSVARQRHPLPSEEDQQASLTLIKDVFQKEYGDTKTKTQKASLAKKLLVQAGQSRDDLSGRYMLYRESRRLATLAGDSSTAINAAKSLAREYDLDPMAIILETTRALNKAVQFTAQRKSLAEITLRLIDEAVRDNQFDPVESLIEIALSTARASRDRNLVKKVVDRKKDLAEFIKAYAAAEKGLKTLKENPDDPLANLIAGRFVCFIQNDWQRGLPMLVKGSDETLKALATADLANPQEGNDRAALGDRWLEISASLEGRMQKNAQQRAAMHYKQALGRLKGLSRARIDKKLKAMLGN